MKRYEQKNVSNNPYEPWQELREDSDGEWAEHAEAVAEIAAEVAKRDVRIEALEAMVARLADNIEDIYRGETNAFPLSISDAYGVTAARALLKESGK